MKLLMLLLCALCADAWADDIVTLDGHFYSDCTGISAEGYELHFNTARQRLRVHYSQLRAEARAKYFPPTLTIALEKRFPSPPDADGRIWFPELNLDGRWMTNAKRLCKKSVF